MYHKYGPGSKALRAHALDSKRWAKNGPFGVALFAPSLEISVLGGGLTPGHTPAQPQFDRVLGSQETSCLQKTRGCGFTQVFSFLPI